MRRRILLIIIVPIIVVIGLTALATALLQAADIDVVAILESTFGPSVSTGRLEQVLNVLRVPLNLLTLVMAFVAAYVVSRLSFRLSGWILDAANVSRYTSSTGALSEDQMQAVSARRLTLQQLIASLIGFGAFTVAGIYVLSQFMSVTNLAVLATVLANAFGFAARDYVGDLLNGVSNLFEDRFDVGDNVEIVRLEDELRGIVEQVNIRTMGLRTRSGELVIVPQGQVRILRNFTRGAFTGTDVTLSVAASDLTAAMKLLVELSEEAPDLLPDLIEPWRIISEEGNVNSVSALTIFAKAAYGRGAQLRLEIMSLVTHRLDGAGIALAD